VDGNGEGAVVIGGWCKGRDRVGCSGWMTSGQRESFDSENDSDGSLIGGTMGVRKPLTGSFGAHPNTI